MSATQGKPREFTGRHMLLLMVSFFGVILAVNVLMATLSATSWTGLVVTNSYVASQEFETRRIAHEAQLAAGWSSELQFDAGTVRLRVVDGLGNPVDLGEPLLSINRPVGGHDDQKLALLRDADGTYTAALSLDVGVWDALVEADTDLGQFELRERFSASGAGQ